MTSIPRAAIVDFPVASPRSIKAKAREYVTGEVSPWHRHDRGQLVYSATGVMELSCMQGQWLIPPQRALWIPPFVVHSMRARGAVSLRTLYIESSTCTVPFPSAPHAACVSPLLRELLLRAMQMPEVYDEHGKDARILQLLVEEIQWSSAERLHLPMARDPRLAKVCDTIISDPASTRTLQTLAFDVGASTRTLSRLFQTEFHMTFLTWRHQLCVQLSVPMLIGGESVGRVACALGYETPTAFSTLFKRLMGVSPQQFCSTHIPVGR